MDEEQKIYLTAWIIAVAAWTIFISLCSMGLINIGGSQ